MAEVTIWVKETLQHCVTLTVGQNIEQSEVDWLMEKSKGTITADDSSKIIEILNRDSFEQDPGATIFEDLSIEKK